MNHRIGNALESTPRILCLALCLATSIVEAQNWRQIHVTPLRPFSPQQPKRIELADGLVVLLLEDHELPLVRATAEVRGGFRDEPRSKAGLVSIYGEVWRTGGTSERTGDEIDDYLEAMAAKVETRWGLESTSLSWDCMKENLDQVFRVFADILRKPEFREDKIVLAKNRLNSSISRRNDNSSEIALRESKRLVYGMESPYAGVPEYSTVSRITRNDLLEWHRTYVQPNNIIFGIVGDFDPDAVESKIRTTFGQWPRGVSAKKAADPDSPRPSPGVYFIRKENVTASTIRLLGTGTLRDDPDYYAIEVFNELFGGSYSSRLFSDIRSKRGLAYTIGGGVGTEFDHPGMLQVRLNTKSSSTVAAIKALYEEMDGLNKDSVTQEELQKAKDTLLNSFIFRFDSKDKVLHEQMSYELYGYPHDFMERYCAGILGVTGFDIDRVVRKYMGRDRLTLLVIGKDSDFDGSLSSFGVVHEIDVSIPSAKD